MKRRIALKVLDRARSGEQIRGTTLMRAWKCGRGWQAVCRNETWPSGYASDEAYDLLSTILYDKLASLEVTEDDLS